MSCSKRIGRPPIAVDAALVILLYQGFGHSAADIGPMLGVNYVTVLRRLREIDPDIIITKHYPYSGGVVFLHHASRFKGYHHSKESRQKMSRDRKGQNTWSKGRHLSTETKQKMGAASRKLWKTPGYREGQVKRMKEHWADPEYSSRVRPKILRKVRARPTGPERRIIEIIKEFDLPFRYVGNGKVMIGNLNPDFINCNGRKEVIEVFGDYWHGKGIKRQSQTIEGRKAILASYGFECIVLWEKEINSLPKEEIVRRITHEQGSIPDMHDVEAAVSA